jgi:hypothetical protein
MAVALGMKPLVADFQAKENPPGEPGRPAAAK